MLRDSVPVCLQRAVFISVKNLRRLQVADDAVTAVRHDGDAVLTVARRGDVRHMPAGIQSPCLQRVCQSRFCSAPRGRAGLENTKNPRNPAIPRTSVYLHILPTCGCSGIILQISLLKSGTAHVSTQKQHIAPKRRGITTQRNIVSILSYCVVFFNTSSQTEHGDSITFKRGVTGRGCSKTARKNKRPRRPEDPSGILPPNAQTPRPVPGRLHAGDKKEER